MKAFMRHAAIHCRKATVTVQAILLVVPMVSLMAILTSIIGSGLL